MGSIQGQCGALCNICGLSFLEPSLFFLLRTVRRPRKMSYYDNYDSNNNNNTILLFAPGLPEEKYLIFGLARKNVRTIASAMTSYYNSLIGWW